MARTNPLSAAFWADAPAEAPGSYASLEARRRIAEQLAGKKSPFPKTIGEGLTYFGESLVERARMNELADAERSGDVYADSRLNDIRNTPGGYVPPAEGAVGSVAPAVPVARAASVMEAPAPAARATPVAAADPDTFYGAPVSTVPSPVVNKDTEKDAPLPDDAQRARLAALLTPTPMMRPGGMAADLPPLPPADAVTAFGPMDPATRFNGASDQPAPAPPSQPASGERVPLPPPRPVYDRNQQLAEVQDNPALADRIRTIAKGESADPREQQIVAETIFNRAAARNQPLEQVTRQYTGPQSTGYYPASTFGRGQISEDALAPVLRGSDVGGQALGFSPTGNASADVAANGIRRGTYNSAGRLPGSGETFVQQERPAQLERLAGTRLASLDNRAMASAAQFNPPIVTDIKPMPQQVAENSPGIPPSRLPIPPDVPQEMKHPGPEPVQPRPLGPSEAQQKMETIFSDRRLDPSVREAAKRRLDAEEGYRKELEAARNNKYTNDRAQWNQDVRAYDKFQTEAPVRAIDQRIKLLTIQKAAADEERRPQDAEKLRLEIANAELARQKALQELVKPQVEKQGDRIFERPPGPAGTPFTEAVGIPKSEKLTEEQAKALRYWQRGYVADQQIGDTNVLESLKSSALNRVPLVGNYAIPPEYRSAKYKADQWLLANVRHESGASIRPDEIPAFYHNYFPVPGDDEKAMREKDARRALTVKGVYDSLGDAKPAGDRFIEERNARKVTGGVPEMTIRTSRKTGQRQIHLNGYWEDIP